MACFEIPSFHSSRSQPFYQLFPSPRLLVSYSSHLLSDCFRKELLITPRSQTGRAHLLLISNTPGKEGGAIGVVTLEGLFRLF